MKKSLGVLIVSIVAIIAALLIDSWTISPFLYYPALLAAAISLFSILIIIVKNKIKKDNNKYYISFYVIVITSFLIFAVVSTLTIGFMFRWDMEPITVIMLIVFNLLLSILYTYLYFLPYITAVKKEHTQVRAIYILNIFAGWTIIAWIISLIWANTVPKEQIFIEQKVQQSDADELKKYKELLNSGIITQEEFDAKKKQLLGL